MRFAPLTMVFATSNARMQITVPFAVDPEAKPVLGVKFTIPLTIRSNPSTALPKPALLTLPTMFPPDVYIMEFIMNTWLFLSNKLVFIHSRL